MFDVFVSQADRQRDFPREALVMTGNGASCHGLAVPQEEPSLMIIFLNLGQRASCLPPA